jgi:hypothetical protein
VYCAERDPARTPPDHDRNGDPDDGESDDERGRVIHSKKKSASPNFGDALWKTQRSAVLSDQCPDRADATIAPVMIEDPRPGNFAVAVAASMYWSELILVAGRSRNASGPPIRVLSR